MRNTITIGDNPMSHAVAPIDDPAPRVRHITLNRTEKPDAPNHALRGEIIQALEDRHKPFGDCRVAEGDRPGRSR